MEGVVKVGAADESFGHYIRKSLAQAEFGVHHVVKHAHVNQLHGVLVFLTILAIALIGMAEEAVLRRNQLFVRIGKYLQLLFAGNGQLHVGVLQATQLGLDITEDARPAMTVKTGDTCFPMPRMLPGIDLGQGAETMLGMTHGAELRFGGHVQNLDVDERENDKAEDGQQRDQEEVSFAPAEEIFDLV